MHFVFMHIGQDTEQSHMLVQSIRRNMPEAHITQCSDKSTDKIKGVNRIFRTKISTKNLMTLRLECFAELETQSGAYYIDTDMLSIRPPPPACSELLLCERSFGRDSIFNHQFRNMDFSEYQGQTLGRVYPYLACFTYTKTNEFWQKCNEDLAKLDEKFHRWYGDQEAIRNVGAPLVSSGHAQTIPESIAACLPEHLNPHHPPFFVHFKGANRKPLMRQLFEKICR
jgi:hypothetical protein